MSYAQVRARIHANNLSETNLTNDTVNNLYYRAIKEKDLILIRAFLARGAKLESWNELKSYETLVIDEGLNFYVLMLTLN